MLFTHLECFGVSFGDIGCRDDSLLLNIMELDGGWPAVPKVPKENTI